MISEILEKAQLSDQYASEIQNIVDELIKLDVIEVL